MEEYVETLSGKRVKMSIIEEAAYDSLETIMSVLPEEAQTYDMILFAPHPFFLILQLNLWSLYSPIPPTTPPSRRPLWRKDNPLYFLG